MSQQAGSKKKVLITGITGQVGSFLADLLLKEGYEVHGMIRRTSSYVRQRIDHLTMDPNIKEKTLFLHYGDMTDGSNISRLIEKIKPDFCVNMAAQSHVKISFDVPEYSADVDGVGVVRLLDAIREIHPSCRFIQASTSEMFGLVQETPQTENTKFYPRSPYAAAKVFGFHVTRNYREAYNIFASNIIMFNNECFFKDTPIILRENNEIDIIYIHKLIANRTNISHDSNILTKDYNNSNIEIWDGENFVKLKSVSRKKLSFLEKENQYKRITNSRCGTVATTPNHKLITKQGEKLQAKYFNIKDYILEGKLPKPIETKEISSSYAKLLGMLTGDGYVSETELRFINNNIEKQKEFKKCCLKTFCNIVFKKHSHKSGFDGTTTYITVNGINKITKLHIRSLIYETKTKHKKVPTVILNSSKEIQLKFLEGYYLADGLKADNCTYRFKSFCSNSPLLAQGVLFLINNITNQTWNMVPFVQNDKFYYKINLHSDETNGNSGQHFKKPSNQITKIETFKVENQHVFDIETSSGKVLAGVGSMIVGNSERRGENFVTRKITMSVARIVNGLQKKVSLGNLAALRDWGYTPDFCEAILKIMKHSVADDFVIATGENHSVEEFCTVAFEYAGLPLEFRGKGINRKGYDKAGNVKVDVNPEYFRPTEVETLLGDASKAKEILDWEPTVKFDELVKIMVKYDLENINE